MPRGRTTDARVVWKIYPLALLRVPATEIWRVLQNDPELGAVAPASVKTVRAIIEDIMPRDPSDPWTLADASPEEARVVLPELAAVIAGTRGSVSAVSVAIASYIAKLKGAVPDLPPFSAYRLAVAYLKREEKKAPTTDLDLFMAFAPWRGKAEALAYETAISQWKMNVPAATRNLYKALWADGRMAAQAEPEDREVSDNG